jgi:hypothetical protein
MYVQDAGISSQPCSLRLSDMLLTMYMPLPPQTAGAKSITELLKAVLPQDDGFLQAAVRSMHGKLAFQDGVYYFKERQFRTFQEAEQDGTLPLAAMAAPCPFPRTRDEHMIQQVNERVWYPVMVDSDPESIEVMKHLKLLLARGLAHMTEDKFWVLVYGPRDCGKGVMQTAMVHSFGPKVVKVVNLGNLEVKKAADDTQKAYSWLMDGMYAGVLYASEADEVESSGR